MPVTSKRQKIHVSSEVTEYAAWQILEYLDQQPKKASAGKAVRDVARTLTPTMESRNSALRGLYLIGAVAMYNNSRAQWLRMTPRGLRLLTDYRQHPPAQQPPTSQE